MKGILMVGEQRSGSNLLRLILDQSPQIAGPHPPHILQRLMPLVALYGNLREPPRFQRLVDDVCRLVETNPVAWEGVALERTAVAARCREHSLVAVFGAVMDMYAEAHGAEAWLCKSMQNIRWAEQINAYFESPRYLFLHRDPRDVALSFAKAPIGDKHPYFVARQWAELQMLCLRERARRPDQFFTVCYEDLTEDPRAVVEALCGFLGIEFAEQMLQFHASGEATRTASSSELWQNVTRPVMRANSQKFIREMSQEQIRIVESVTGELMDVLGYERVFVGAGEEHEFDEQEIARFARENDALKAAKVQATDPADLQRRRRQAEVLERIRAMAS